MNGDQDNSLILAAGQLTNAKANRPDSITRALEALNSQPKVLHFPTSSLGTLILRKKDPQKNYLDFFTFASFFAEETADQLLEAQGSVTIPGNFLVGLRVNEINQDTLKCLSRLHANALDALSFLGLSILTNELEFIANLKGIRLLTLSDTNINDQSFEYISAFPKLEKLFLTGTNVTDLGLQALRALATLQHFRLQSTSDRNFPITDKTLAVLGELENLKIIFLENTEITDQGLIALTKLKQLRSLSLSNNDLSDACTEYLKEIKSLSILQLQHTKLSDKAVENLCQLQNLTFLDLWGTKISEEAVAWLYERLPHCVHILYAEGIYPEPGAATPREHMGGYENYEDEEEVEEVDEVDEEELKEAQRLLAKLKEIETTLERFEASKKADKQKNNNSQDHSEDQSKEYPQPEYQGPVVLGWWPT